MKWETFFSSSTFSLLSLRIKWETFLIYAGNADKNGCNRAAKTVHTFRVYAHITSICISIQSHSLCIRCVYHASFTASSSYFSQCFCFFVCAEAQNGNMTYEIFIYLLSTTQRNAGGRLDNFFCTSNSKKGRKIH